MRNDYGNYYLLILTDENEENHQYLEYDNAEAARKHARMNEQSNPNGTRRLFKCIQNHEPIEVMV